MVGVSRSMSAIPPEELPILESLINIRNRLTALKKNSSDYIRAQDVQNLYQAVIKQVSKLNSIRDERDSNEGIHQAPSAASGVAGDVQDPLSPSAKASSSSATTSTNPLRPEVESSAIQTNRVDTTLQDVFSLLSLFFLTIGKSRETPATFSQLGSMKQLLDHLAESGIYTETDLQPFAKRLSELREIIRRDTEQGKHPTQLTKLMMRKLEGCEKVLQQLQGTLSVLSVELVPIHQKLVSIRRQIAAAAAKLKPARGEIRKLQDELRAIDSKRVDGKFLGPGGSSVPAGQAILVGLLEECFEICHDAIIRNDEVPMTLQPIYDRLTEIKSQLEHLVLTHRWTLRETDLWNYQVTLKEIDRLRVDGKFVDAEGKQPEGQLVLLYLLRRCYGLVYRLVASSEPISEELMPISNKLSTVSKCLKEVSKYGGPFTMRDLYPYRLALHQIDNMKSPVLDKDGNDTGVKKWLGRDGSVPEGQAILRAQFEEVEQTINESECGDPEEEEVPIAEAVAYTLTVLNREEDSDDEEDDYDGAVSDEDWQSGDSGSFSEEGEDSASESEAAASGFPSRELSLPGSPTGTDVRPQATLSVASALQGVGRGLPTPTSPPTGSPNLLRSENGSASITALDMPPSVTAPTSASLLNASDPLPPGAATLAVPTPAQNSLTAAAVSLEAMNSAHPPIGGPSSPLAPQDLATARHAGPLMPAGTTGSRSASPSQSADSTTSGAVHPSSNAMAIGPSSHAREGFPAQTTACHHSVDGVGFGSSPGSTDMASKEDIAQQLKAKLALEES